VAGIAGVLSAWSNTRISADSVSLSVSILVLTAAVIGGLNRLPGAWVGAFVYTVCDTYLRGWTDRFSTYLGIVFLVIVLVSPGGIVGLLTSGNDWVRRRLGGNPGDPEDDGAPSGTPTVAGAPVPVTATEGRSA
jgi:branched-chain amino acid transport system permease protein